MLSAMTPNAFRDSFTVKIIEKGLGARFMYFIDEEKKRSKSSVKVNDIPASIINFTKMWRSKNNGNRLKTINGLNVPNIPETQCRIEFLRIHESLQLERFIEACTHQPNITKANPKTSKFHTAKLNHLSVRQRSFLSISRLIASVSL